MNDTPTLLAGAAAALLMAAQPAPVLTPVK
jgi:hypothetical protein